MESYRGRRRETVRPHNLSVNACCFRVFAHRSPNVGNLVQWEQPQNSGGIEVESLFSAENLQYLRNGAI